MDGKLAIALGGGCARGWSHIGILNALSRAGLEPDIIVGTSVGALVGGCAAAGHLEQLTDFARSLTRRSVFSFLDFNLSGSGLIMGRRLSERLETHLGSLSIENLDRRFVAVATEIGTGHEIWLNSGKLTDAMRASYALPGIFRPVRLDNRWLMDGALVNPVPVSVCRALGARVVIAVNLNAEVFGRGAVVPSNVLETPSDASGETSGEDAPQDAAGELLPDPGAPQTGNGRAAIKLLRRQFFGRGDGAPGISTVMMEAFNITQDRITRSRMAGDPPDVVINPKLGGIGIFDFHRADEMIALGESATSAILPALQESIEALAA